jgi:hypothetical protein
MGRSQAGDRNRRRHRRIADTMGRQIAQQLAGETRIPEAGRSACAIVPAVNES